MAEAEREKLNPCPFCGSTDLAVIALARSGRFVEEIVRCLDCLTDGPSHKIGRTGADSWNRRGRDTELEWLRSRCNRLEAAIQAHRGQKADDRLYEALGDGIKCDRRVGNKEDMYASCKRFIDRRCEGGGWPTYVELEAALEESVKLQSHYAGLLNQYDGGLRLGFATVEQWLERLRKCRKTKENTVS